MKFNVHARLWEMQNKLTLNDVKIIHENMKKEMLDKIKHPLNLKSIVKEFS